MTSIDQPCVQKTRPRMRIWAGALSTLLTSSACGGDTAATPDTVWCESNPELPAKVRQSPDACTTGKSEPPPVSAETDSERCVQCTPRCGATKYLYLAEEYYTDTDLPVGSCSTEGETCDMAATAPLSHCSEVVHGCAVNGYRCTCTGGKWACLMISQGSGACVCDDAGAGDASTR